MKKEISEKDWYKNTGTKHYLKKQVNTQMLAGAQKDEFEETARIGFVGMKITQVVEPDILMDSGSTISLFKEKSI